MMERSTRVPQRVLIIGGSSEIGAALGREWLKRGTEEFILTVRDKSRISQLATEIEDEGRRLTSISMDASDPGSLRPTVEDAWSDGDVDVVVIAIGLLGSQPELEQDPRQVWNVLTVNATATIQLAMECVNRMESQGHGTLVLLSSVAGQRGRRDNYVYGASKAALDTFAEGLQQRLADSPISLVLARPGYVHSKMSLGVKPAPFSVTVGESSKAIMRAIERKDFIVWIPSVLGPLFYILKLLPMRLWSILVARFR